MSASGTLVPLADMRECTAGRHARVYRWLTCESVLLADMRGGERDAGPEHREEWMMDATTFKQASELRGQSSR